MFATKECIQQFIGILMDCLDVAFIICHMDRVLFGPKKLTQILMQILPTAYVYDFAYWPFYIFDEKKLCICNNYGICCPHIRTKQHCINTKIYFKNDVIAAFKGPIKPRSYKISCVETPPTLPRGFLLSVQIEVRGVLKVGGVLPKGAKQGPEDSFSCIFRIDERIALVNQITPVKGSFEVPPTPNIKAWADFVLGSKINYVVPPPTVSTCEIMDKLRQHTFCLSTTPMVQQEQMSTQKDNSSKEPNTAEDEPTASTSRDFLLGPD